MKRIALLVLAALWLAGPSPTFAQTPVKICFPTAVGSSGKTSCQEVTATNPLPSTATISGLSALSVTVTNTAAVPVIVSAPNGLGGGSSTGFVTVINTVPVPVSEVNSTQILSAIQAGVATTGSPVPPSSIYGGINVSGTLRGATGINPTGSTFAQDVNIASIGALSLAAPVSITMSNLLTTPNAIKASAGQLMKVYCYNPNSSVAYIQLFNVASGSVTPGTTKPYDFYGIPATSSAGYAMSPLGTQYSTAMSAVATTTATGGTPPTTGMDCSVTIN